jgi:hypothetical protein
MSGREGKNELIFDDVQLEPNTMMTVYHCPVAECAKRNYLDAKSVRTHCRRFHSMLDYEPIPSQAEAQFICQVLILRNSGRRVFGQMNSFLQWIKLQTKVYSSAMDKILGLNSTREQYLKSYP